MVDKEFHCYECGGKGKSRGYECSTCDGEGNPRSVEKVSISKKSKSSKKKAK